MSLALLILVQAAAAPASGLLPIDFDLARYRPAQDGAAGARGCSGGRGGPEEVVVCGRRRQGGDYPMAQWERLFAPRPLTAEIGLGGNTRAGLVVDSVVLDRGAVSKRAMVRLTWPF
jgi:hypothetical protein